MSSIDQIFKKYDTLITSRNRKNAEQLINDYFLLIKDSFLEFYGEARREQIEAKFDSIFFALTVNYFDDLSSAMMSEFDNYLKNKYGYGIYDNAPSTIAGIAYGQDHAEILNRLKPYKELFEKQSKAVKKYRKKFSKK